MSTAEKAQLSEQEYLQGEESGEYKHEFLNGEVWAIVGASDNHATITMNLAFSLKQKLKDTPCRIYISDMKIKVRQANAFFYPDILVSCDKQDRLNSYYKEHPMFIAEVLPPLPKLLTR